MTDNFRKRFFKGISIQKNVISALLFRQLSIKSSQSSLGVIGVFLEPLILILVFLGIFILARGRLVPVINPLVFLTVGIILFRMFASIALNASSTLKSYKPLFFYRPVKPIDAIITSSIQNSCLFVILLICLLFSTALFSNEFYFNDFPLMVAAITLLVIFTFSVAIIIMVACYRFPPLIKVTRFIRRPLFFTSGALFPSVFIPPAVAKYLLINPIFHAIELTRLGTTKGYPIADQISIIYLLEVTFVSLTISLIIYANNRSILLKS